MKNTKLYTALILVLFGIFTVYWVWLGANGYRGETDQAELYSALYGLLALVGGVIGVKVSKLWGGFKSLLGRSVMYLALGLLAQELGQLTYSAYTYLFHTEIPYPSFGDIWFFGSVILYGLSAYYLIKTVTASRTGIKMGGTLLVMFIPAVVLLVSYYTFLRNYDAGSSSIVAVFLDFGYPLGQAIYASMAILAYLLSQKYLGGLMRPVILFVIGSFCIQYAADFMFLYQVHNETWQTGGLNEFIYLCSYLVTSLALIWFGVSYNKVIAGRSSQAGGSDGS